MSELSFITGEIDKILGESTKIVTQEPESVLPSIDETVSAVAGVLMEEFPEGGSSKLFGRALIEASIGSSRDTGLDSGDIFAGLIDFFSQGINEAQEISHLLQEGDDYEEEEAEEYYEEEETEYQEDEDDNEYQEED
jgi:hypothetical protein